MKRPVFHVKPVDRIPVKIRYSISLSYTTPIWALSPHLSLGHATSLFPELYLVSHLEGSYATFLCTKFKDLK
jgi:hypothetical protein